MCVAAFTMTSLITFNTRPLTYDNPEFDFKGGDHHKYIAMATDNPFGYGKAPFNRRILTPLLAQVLPFDIQRNFQVISFFGIFGTGVAAYYLVKAFGLSAALATTGMLMFFSMRWATEFIIADFWLSDALSYLIMVLCVYCIVTNRDALFALLLVIGALNKESIILVAPLLYTFRARGLVDLSAAARTVVVTLPAFVVLIALSLGIPQENSYSALGFLPGKGGGGSRLASLTSLSRRR